MFNEMTNFMQEMGKLPNQITMNALILAAKDLEKLKDELKALQEENSKLKKESEELKTSNTNLSRENAELHDILSQLTATESQDAEDLENIEESCCDMEAIIGDLQNLYDIVDELHNRISVLENGK